MATKEEEKLHLGDCTFTGSGRFKELIAQHSCFPNAMLRWLGRNQHHSGIDG
jgi:hypothetical protein